MVRSGRRRDDAPRAARGAGGGGLRIASPPRPRRRTPAGAAAALLLAILAPLPAAGQDLASQLERVREEIARAQESDLRFVAPRLTATAAEQLREAVERREGGAPQQEVLERLSRADRALAEARDLEARGRELLGPALRAREAAARVGAPGHAPGLWEEAEARLRSAGRGVEDGDAEEARRAADQAADRYRRAERTALESGVLGAARSARDTARERGAPELAPVTFGRADSLLERARSFLAAAGGDGGDPGRARQAADRAREAYLRSARTAARLDTARGREGGVERLLLRYENVLARLADSLGLADVDPGEPAAAADAVLAALARRAEARRELRGRLDSARVAAGRAEGRSDSLAAELERLSRRLDTLSSDLDRRRRREAKLREVRALFAEEEARILTSADSLVLRLVGMSFPPGEAELGEEARSLLVRVQSTIRAFPDARVLIEGHTDSRGDEDRNRTLSRERAIAVREWLLARTPLSADRISARGHGESRPVAPNDTEEGRAANRRIEVILELPSP